MSKQLTPRQRLFVREYLTDLNASAAALRAGYRPDSGRRLLRRPAVRALIDEEIRKRDKRIEISQDKILNELARIAFCNPRAIISWNGSRITLADGDSVSPETAAAISEIAESAGGIRIRFYDKLKAVELLMRHKAMLDDRAAAPARPLSAAACEQMALEAQETLRNLRKLRAQNSAPPPDNSSNAPPPLLPFQENNDDEQN